jgi:hypothetical protein
MSNLPRKLMYFFSNDFKHGLDSFASVTQLVDLIEFHVEQLYLNYAYYRQLKSNMGDMNARLAIVKRATASISMHPLKQPGRVGVMHSE